MEQIIRNMEQIKIILSGGGTGGSVAPLLAVAEELTSPRPSPSPGEGVASFIKGSASPERQRGEGKGGFEFLWIGTKSGLEREMVALAGSAPGEKMEIKFKAIAGGKLRRYFSWRNFIDPFLILVGLWQAFFIMLKWRSDLVMTAGSFVSVPVVWAAWILRVPVLVHQQDARPGLANKLMAPFARVVTVTFEESLKDYGKKAVWTGNPTRLRREIPNSKFQIPNYFNLKKEFPVVLVVGGGTGARAINELVWQSIDELNKFCRIIHITGKDKFPNSRISQFPNSQNYKHFDFLNIDQMAEAYAAADVVVSRAGMGVLTELSCLGKPAILIPMPDSHQEENAEIFGEKEAAVVLNQKELAGGQFAKEIEKLVNDKSLREKLNKNISEAIKRGAGERMVKIIEGLLKEGERAISA